MDILVSANGMNEVSMVASRIKPSGLQESKSDFRKHDTGQNFTSFLPENSAPPRRAIDR
jgi:hypothetical protein